MTIGEAAATAAAVSLISKATPAIAEKIANITGQKIVEFRAKFFKNFERHLSNSLQKSRYVKTVVSKDKPVLLEKIYVPLTLTSDGDTFEDRTVDPTRRQGARFIISGTGGAGKTILMKHLLNVACDNTNFVIPLFFELRSLKLDIFSSLEEALHFELIRDGGEESRALFDACLAEGALAVFLDGFDEIHPDRVEGTLREVEQFSRKFTKASIILSTRPSTGLQELTDFDVYHVNPLSKTQAIAVVDKTKFDEASKSKFLDALAGGMYEKHQTMMSIPILVVMMLLTFRSYGDIPDRMTVFYGQAFDTLASIHDNEGKNQFKRVYRSGLAPDQFKQVLESFCYRSLAQHEIEFTQDSLENYFRESLKYEKYDPSPAAFQADLVQNVCILQPDGISFVFVHRSFQEYFAARFALRYSGSRQFDVIDRVVQGRGGGVPKMLDEMNRPKFYREWLLPMLARQLEQMDEIIKLATRETCSDYE